MSAATLEDIKRYCVLNDPQKCYWNVFNKSASWVTDEMKFHLGLWYCEAGHLNICAHLLNSYQYSNKAVSLRIHRKLCTGGQQQYCLISKTERPPALKIDPEKVDTKIAGSDSRSLGPQFFKLEVKKIEEKKADKNLKKKPATPKQVSKEQLATSSLDKVGKDLLKQGWPLDWWAKFKRHGDLSSVGQMALYLFFSVLIMLIFMAIYFRDKFKTLQKQVNDQGDFMASRAIRQSREKVKDIIDRHANKRDK